MNILITGGCGFIGSNFVRHILTSREDVALIVLDALTYAGNLQNLSGVLDDPRLCFMRGDIADPAIVLQVAGGSDVIVNFAAESHVDRSIMDSAPFVRTNVGGTQVLLDAANESGARFIQISTDEVYGSLGPTGLFTEASPLEPNSPYSASKAAADLLVRSYMRTHDLAASVVRPCNAYGPYQFPEKLIPLMITNARANEPLPVYGDGAQVREWVHVADLCDAILRVIEDGRNGETYNVGTGEALANLDVVRSILRRTGAPESLIRFVPDRPGHDRRYALDATKIARQLDWKPRRDFETGLDETLEWYVNNDEWMNAVRSGAYRRYYERQYAVEPAVASTSSSTSSGQS